MTRYSKTELVRQQIVAATDDLLYHKGYNSMSFSDIAEASGIPRGNLSYHFKTKKDVLNAVLEHRIQGMEAMLADWEETFPRPLERLKRYARIPLNEHENVVHFGCPMGSLNIELGKQQRELQHLSRRQFDIFRQWLEKQFSALLPESCSGDLAMHLLVRTQGIAVMAQAYADEALLKREVDLIMLWLDSQVSS